MGVLVGSLFSVGCWVGRWIRTACEHDECDQGAVFGLEAVEQRCQCHEVRDRMYQS